MKKLLLMLGLASSLIFLPVANAGDVPERFRNYRDAKCAGNELGISKGGKRNIWVAYYDTNRDGKRDVFEFYTRTVPELFKHIYTWFDIDGDGKQEGTKELFIDTKGLGNIDDFISLQEYLKRKNP